MKFIGDTPLWHAVHILFGPSGPLKLSVHFRICYELLRETTRTFSFWRSHSCTNPCKACCWWHWKRFLWWAPHYRTTWRIREYILQRQLILLSWYCSPRDIQHISLAGTLPSRLGTLKILFLYSIEIRRLLIVLKGIPMTLGGQFRHSSWCPGPCTIRLLWLHRQYSCFQVLISYPHRFYEGGSQLEVGRDEMGSYPAPSSTLPTWQIRWLIWCRSKRVSDGLDHPSTFLCL